jgi:hypothetical protein
MGSASVPCSARSPFAALLRHELGHAFRARHAVALVAISLMGLVLAFWLPGFPESVYRFFQRIFQLNGWAEIVVANDLVGLFFFIYWIGVFDILGIYIVPLEERYLEVYLSKPLRRRGYMLARVAPVMLIVGGLGIVSAMVHWLTLVAAGLDYSLRVYLGAATAVIAWTLALIAVVNIAILFVRDTNAALLVAFIPMAASILPGLIYMYRPDVFEDAPLLRAVAVFPNTLIWHPDFSARWGLVLAAAFCCAALALIAAAGKCIEARDTPVQS